MGCVVECGIGYGRSLQIIHSLLIMKKLSRTIFAFDSFKGFPELSFEDTKHSIESRKGAWKVVKRKHILEILNAPKNSPRPSNPPVQMNIIEGFFEDSITSEIQNEIRNCGGICLLHLDVDLYKSYKVTLEKFWDLVNQGGYILFDEYHGKSLKKIPGSK